MFTRRLVIKELILWSALFIVFIIFLIGNIYCMSLIEAGQELQERPRGTLLGWLMLITLGFLLKRSSRGYSESLPRSIIIMRETLQAIMLFLFFVVLSCGTYIIHHSRPFVARKPLMILVGWFALITFVTFFIKSSEVIRDIRKK